MIFLIGNIKERLTSSHGSILTINIDGKLATSTSTSQEVVIDVNNTISSGTIVNPYRLLKINPIRLHSIRTSMNSIGVTNRRSNIAHHISVLIGTFSNDSVVTLDRIIRSKKTRGGIIFANEIAEIVVGANAEEDNR